MSRGHMLLVEDDAALAELVTWHFRKEGFDVAHTPDGEEALIMAQERVPDIVLLDWMVENLSGIEVCRRLRRNSNTANARRPTCEAFSPVSATTCNTTAVDDNANPPPIITDASMLAPR